MVHPEPERVAFSDFAEEGAALCHMIPQHGVPPPAESLLAGARVADSREDTDLGEDDGACGDRNPTTHQLIRHLQEPVPGLFDLTRVGAVRRDRGVPVGRMGGGGEEDVVEKVE